MAQILRPRHTDPFAPQTSAQIFHRHALDPPPHQHIPDRAQSPAGPRPLTAVPTTGATQRSAHARLARAQERALAHGLRSPTQRRAGRLEPCARAVGLRRDGTRSGGSASGACRRGGASHARCSPYLPGIGSMCDHPVLTWPVLSSFLLRHMSPHRRKSPGGHHTSHTIRGFLSRILSAMPCSTSFVRLLIRQRLLPPLPPLHLPLLPTTHRHHRPRLLHPSGTTNITY